MKGPPGEPFGVRVDNKTLGHTGSVDVLWQSGLDRGYAVSKFRIQTRSVFDGEDEWETLADDVNQVDTQREVQDDWRFYR